MAFFTHLVRSFTFALCCCFLARSTQAQRFNQDSLMSVYRSNPRYFYVKPVIGLHWTHSMLRGEPPFIDHGPFDNRNVRWGLLIGKQTGRIGIETGVTTFPVYTGFRFISDDNFMTGGGTRVGYWHFPLTVQYALLRPAKRLQINPLTGISFNTQIAQSFLPARYTSSSTTTNPNGTTSTTTGVYETRFRTKFLAAMLGVNVNYRVLKRVDLSLQVSRPFSANNIVRKTVELTQNSDPTVYRATMQAGAGGISVLLGLQYRFDPFKSYGRYRNVSF